MGVRGEHPKWVTDAEQRKRTVSQLRRDLERASCRSVACAGALLDLDGRHCCLPGISAPACATAVATASCACIRTVIAAANVITVVIAVAVALDVHRCCGAGGRGRLFAWTNVEDNGEICHAWLGYPPDLPVTEAK